MKLDTLYSRTNTGAIQSWTIEIKDDRYRVHHGQVGGKITITRWTIAAPTNVGRANERDACAQACFEARAAWQRKLDSGATPNISDIDVIKFIEPMLAKKWEDRCNKIIYPVYSQPKLDGLRAIITRHGAKSRNGKPWVTIGHILEELRPLFKKYPDLVLDGELYTHQYRDDFNKICSLVKKTKPSENDLLECSQKVEFWWYDIIDTTLQYSERHKLIHSLLQKYLPVGVRIVPTNVVYDNEELDDLYNSYMLNGYEGQMIRVNDVYENKRSNFLLKRKEFSDAEYKIIKICEGNGNKTGMAGYMILSREDGKTFHSNIKGTHEYLVSLLKNSHKYIGKYATCKYFNLTPDGIPRFPYVIGIREAPGID